MSGTGVGYDLSCPTFSPDGKIFQLEYAAKAVNESGLVIGVCCKDGVVLAVEKLKISPLLSDSSNSRISTISSHAGIAVAGFLGDSQALAKKARQNIAERSKTFGGSRISAKIICSTIADLLHHHTLYWDIRPFAANVLLATYTKREGPQLFGIDPSGASFRFFANALGKNSEAAKTELGKTDFAQISCKEAAPILAEIVYRLHDDVKESGFELEMSWVCDESHREHTDLPAELLVSSRLRGAEAKRKADMDDD